MVTGSRVTPLRSRSQCHNAFLFPLQNAACLEIGMGCWKEVESDRQQWAEERAEGLPVKRLEWHLAQVPRCIVAFATMSWQR